MGCDNSKSSSVQPLTPGPGRGDENETAGKPEGRGDSATSKGTTDSGVVMENREIPVLPGAVPSKLPPPTCFGESEADRVTLGGSQKLKRQDSSEILKELLSQGIIPLGQQSAERSGGAGEAYSIILDEGVKRRPPARLESLKSKKEQSLYSREEMEEKIRLVEERRKLKEDELKMRLRSKSARIRNPGTSLTPVEPLQSPLCQDALDSPPGDQISQETAKGGELVRKDGGDGRECEEERGRAEGERGESRDDREEVAERVGEDDKGEEEVTQVEELRKDQLHADMTELESDSSFQHVGTEDEIF